MTMNDEPHSLFIDGDVRLHAADWGGNSDQRLLLLHGLSANARVWDEYAREARDQYHVVALDARGHGDSSWSEQAAYGTFDHMEDIGRVLDELGWEDAAIIGSSMGGRNAMAFAAAFPERVTRLVLVDIGPGRRESDPPLPPAPANENREENPRSFASREEAAQWMYATYPSRSLELSRHRVLHNTRLGADGRYNWKWDPNLYAAWSRSENLWGLLGNITCPVLLLRGEDSYVLSRAVGEEMERTLPDCRLVEIAGVGHNIYTDVPDVFRAAVNPFLGIGAG